MRKYKVLHGDYRDLFPVLTACDTIFADPPDNIDLGYDEYDDKLENAEYNHFLETLVRNCIQKARTSFISFNAKWMTPMGNIITKLRERGWEDFEDRWMIQAFTFGQHNKHDFANNFRPIVRLRQKDAPIFTDAIRVESQRMKIKDKRANPAGRVPGEVWKSDFLEYARVVGNSKQRRRWHPTQLHEGLVEDLLLSSTPPGGSIIDPFAGTGTTMRVALSAWALEWNCTVIDIDAGYCNKITLENDIPWVAKGIWTLNKEHNYG